MLPTRDAYFGNDPPLPPKHVKSVSSLKGKVRILPQQAGRRLSLCSSLPGNKTRGQLASAASAPDNVQTPSARTLPPELPAFKSERRAEPHRGARNRHPRRAGLHAAPSGSPGWGSPYPDATPRHRPHLRRSNSLGESGGLPAGALTRTPPGSAPPGLTAADFLARSKVRPRLLNRPCCLSPRGRAHGPNPTRT